LQKNWKISADVLYDKANTEVFKPTDIEEKHELFKKLGLLNYEEKENKDVTIFTEVGEKGKINYRKSRPLLLISSTSWTKDEVNF
jgi:beta-1,4-mannosyltransferase